MSLIETLGVLGFVLGLLNIGWAVYSRRVDWKRDDAKRIADQTAKLPRATASVRATENQAGVFLECLVTNVGDVPLHSLNAAIEHLPRGPQTEANLIIEKIFLDPKESGDLRPLGTRVFEIDSRRLLAGLDSSAGLNPEQLVIYIGESRLLALVAGADVLRCVQMCRWMLDRRNGPKAKPAP